MFKGQSVSASTQQETPPPFYNLLFSLTLCFLFFLLCMTHVCVHQAESLSLHLHHCIFVAKSSSLCLCRRVTRTVSSVFLIFFKGAVQHFGMLCSQLIRRGSSSLYAKLG